MTKREGTNRNSHLKKTASKEASVSELLLGLSRQDVASLTRAITEMLPKRSLRSLRAAAMKPLGPPKAAIDAAVAEGMSAMLAKDPLLAAPQGFSMPSGTIPRGREETAIVEAVTATLSRLMSGAAVETEASLQNVRHGSFSTTLHEDSLYGVVDGQVVLAIHDLRKAENKNLAMSFQMVSLVVEVIALVVGLCGIKVSSNPSLMARVINKLAENSKFVRAVQTLATVLADKLASLAEKAKGLIQFFRVMQSIKAMYTLVKAYLSNMAWYEYVLAGASVIAYLVLAFGTGGSVVIAQIALVLVGAAYLFEKIYKIATLTAIRAAP